MANLETPNEDIINTVIDPVCGMEVYPVGIRRIAIYCGRAYWFCSLECRTAFEMNPRKYLDAKREKRKGSVRRYLRWMARTNKEALGTVDRKCHCTGETENTVTAVAKIPERPCSTTSNN